ncbi:hypothetical protein GWM83_02615, partial [Candidatus Bathyarchaeota archaeon]|nr:hypothetical protein [Candidatus Bathyarchaeota archaeon]NIR13110.1 hypothetical protein [Desulfobacterales bacterium]NIW34439.1 hypothetical protein [Candidatus Bathyarchaeota archaeon]
GPVFEPQDEEYYRLKVYLDQEVYDDLVKRSEEKDLTPQKLLSHVLTDWVDSG